MAANYLKMTSDTMEALPVEKQAEVYDFAAYLKTKSKTRTMRSRKSSLLSLVGMGRSKHTDVSVNHDKYLYEQK
ncbi:MAG: hypothetical protein V1913_00940 [Fibrobacterota bacterium]